jgi:hypothetical protein
MTPKFMPLLEMCLENGIKRGLARAYKHTDEPSSQEIENALMLEITNEIYEWFNTDVQK